MRMERTGLILVISASMLFGALTVVARIGYMHGAEPLSMLLTRNLIVACVLIGILLAYQKGFPALTVRQHLRLSGLGLMIGTFTYLYMGSVQYIPASLAVMLFYTYPALVAVIAVATVGEKLTPIRIASLVLATAGVATMVGASTIGITGIGVGLALGAALVMSVMFFIAEGIGREVRPLVLSAYTMSVAAFAYLLVSLITGGVSLTFTTPVWTVIGITAVLTIGGTLLIFRGIALLGAARSAIASYVEPVVTILLSALLLAEGLTLIQVGGTIMILVGIRLAQSAPGIPVEPSADPADHIPTEIGGGYDRRHPVPGTGEILEPAGSTARLQPAAPWENDPVRPAGSTAPRHQAPPFRNPGGYDT